MTSAPKHADQPTSNESSRRRVARIMTSSAALSTSTSSTRMVQPDPPCSKGGPTPDSSTASLGSVRSACYRRRALERTCPEWHAPSRPRRTSHLIFRVPHLPRRNSNTASLTRRGFFCSYGLHSGDALSAPPRHSLAGRRADMLFTSHRRSTCGTVPPEWPPLERGLRSKLRLTTAPCL
jgi:hypothetical protein